MKNVRYPYQKLYYQRNIDVIKAKQKIYRAKRKEEINEKIGRRTILTGLSLASLVVSPMVLMWALPQYSWNIFATFLIVTLFFLIFAFTVLVGFNRELKN